jgi:cytoskeletal protein CcmA (bactofilin family)
MNADFPTAPRGTSHMDSSFGSPLTREVSSGAVASGDCPNVLAKDTEFSGTIEVTDSIRLEGKFKGEVWTQGTLHVVPEANVDAKIHAAYVVIGGTFKGDVECDRRVDLLADCRATGKLVTGALSVEEGAVFDGEVAMTKRPTPAS